jgi:hypothetical protein
MQAVQSLTLQSFVLPRLWRRIATDLRASVATVVLIAICLAGCNTESTRQVVAEIAAQIPVAQTVVTTAAAAAEGIDPAAALLIATTANTVQVALAALQTLCTAYAQSQDASVLASIAAAINALLNSNATALLDAAHLTDPTSRGIALMAIGTLHTALLLISVILQKSQSASQITATAASRTYKLRDVAPYLDRNQVEQATGMHFDTALRYEEAQGF